MIQAAPSATEIPPSELWLKFTSQKRPFKEVDFPRKDPSTGEPIGKLAMWPLTQGEIIVAQSTALAFAQELTKKTPELSQRIEGTAVYNNAVACEILFRCCRRIENPDLPVFPTAAEVRHQQRGLTSDECAVLMNSYEFVQLELGPIAAFMTDIEREALIKRLQEGGSAIPLASLSLAQWSDLTLYLVAQLSKSRIGSALPGSPPDDLTSSSSE